MKGGLHGVGCREGGAIKVGSTYPIGMHTC